MNRSETYEGRWSKVGAPLAAQAVPSVEGEKQYSLSKILGIWAGAVVPMVILGWLVAPFVADRVNFGAGQENNAAFARAALLTVGLIWQFVLAMAIIMREEGDLSWRTVRRRCWLNAPSDPKSGIVRGKLWLWLLPLTFLFAFIQMAPLAEVWNQAVPFLGEPDKYSFQILMESEERKGALEGAWQLLALFVVLGIFNTILGEELLFRGVLLPRMRGVFGKRDWLANGVLFGLYHLHQPWTIVPSMLRGVLCYAWPTKRFRSAWFGIIIHSIETVLFIFIALGLVLGFA